MAITNIRSVQKEGQFTNEYEDSEILTEIDIVESNMYDRYNLPKRSQFVIDDDYTNFYISPDKVHEIIRVQVSVETTVDPSGYLTIEQEANTWEFQSPNNYITLSSSFISQYDSKIVRIQYIPYTYHIMATTLTALNLIDPTTIVDGENQTPPLVARLRGKLDRLKSIVKPKIILQSSQYNNYNKFDYVSYNQSELR